MVDSVELVARLTFVYHVGGVMKMWRGTSYPRKAGAWYKKTQQAIGDSVSLAPRKNLVRKRARTNRSHNIWLVPNSKVPLKLNIITKRHSFGNGSYRSNRQPTSDGDALPLWGPISHSITVSILSHENRTLLPVRLLACRRIFATDTGILPLSLSSSFQSYRKYL